MPAMKFIRLAAPLLSLALPLCAIAQSEVEPGVTLTSAVSAVEHTPDGHAKVETIHPTAILSNAHTDSNIARGLVYSGQHNTVELAGVTSNLTLTTATPTFYIHIDPDDPNNQRNMITLVRLKPTKVSRIVFNFSANAFGGSRKRHVDAIAVTKADVTGNWLKITPQAPLPPGEYGIVFLPAQAMLFPDRVYDFSVPSN
jgi:hypothetical protein